MRRFPGILTGLLAVGFALPVPADTPLRRPTAPVADRVEMVDGRQYFGLVESKDDLWLYLTEIHRSRGHSSYVVIRSIDRSAIAKVDLLEGDDRQRLQRRIQEWLHRARIESGRMEAVQLKAVDRDHRRFQHYRGKWFDLDSSTDEESTRRIIVRVEQMFTAYRQVLPPRTDARSRLRLLVLGSLDEYRTYLARYGLNVGNPAVYDPEHNLVLAGSELARYLAQLQQVKTQHDRLRQELSEAEDQLQPRLAEVSAQLQAQGIPQEEIKQLLRRSRIEAEAEIKKKRNQLAAFDRDNRKAFDKVTEQMFRRLYHEAFHAYLENYVYPHDQYDVPVWLNEGLAMLFERGILESDTLRLDAPHPAALRQLKDEIRDGRMMPLGELLSAGPKAFLAPGLGPAKEADRHYAYAWGLVYYLAFEADALESARLDGYVDLRNKDLPPTQRFEKLVPLPLGQLQTRWRDYFLELH